MEELIRLGAYRAGSDQLVDEAIFYQPALDGFLAQRKDEATDMATGYAMLESILSQPMPPKELNNA